MTGFDEVGGVGGGCGGNCDDGGESVVAFLCGAALIPNATSIVTTVVGRVATVVGVVTCGVSRFLDSLVMRPGSHVLFVVPMLVLGFGIPARSGDGSGCRRLRCTQRLYGGQGLD